MIKDILKIISWILIVFVIIFVLMYVYTDDENSNKDDEEIFARINTNFPVTHYIIKPKEKKMVFKKSFFPDAPVVSDENKTVILNKQLPKDDSFKNLNTNQQKKKPFFNMNSFSLETKNADNKKKEKLRKKMLKNRGSSLKKDKNPPINSFEKLPNIKDYGADNFDNYNKKDISSHETKLYRTITADKMIPAILINPINSTLMGQVTAQIEDDIYSTLGATLLIPKGSKAIGVYSNKNRIGENRLLLAWTRIITPQGRNIVLTNSESADIEGSSGIVGVVDNKYWERFGIPLSLSTLSNGILLGISNKGNNANNENTAIILDSSRNDLGQIFNSIINEQIKIAPTITVQKGSRIFINPTVDIWFPKPEDGEIIVKYFNTKETENDELYQ
ncbi:MAG: TrbI/VirB10 family protein [Sulfurospirillum sp.]|nr:TrbI/VirB10 family protein [Sulfurospirillum sp.]